MVIFKWLLDVTCGKITKACGKVTVLKRGYTFASVKIGTDNLNSIGVWALGFSQSEARPTSHAPLLMSTEPQWSQREGRGIYQVLAYSVARKSIVWPLSPWRLQDLPRFTPSEPRVGASHITYSQDKLYRYFLKQKLSHYFILHFSPTF